MRVLLQRVNRASVSVGGDAIAAIGVGVLLFAGFGRDEAQPNLERAASRITNLRIFPDDRGRLQYSLAQTGGEILAVPQFTLYGDISRGRRPDFINAMPPEAARSMFDRFVEALVQVSDNSVKAGRFGADMEVSLDNDGPFTLWLEF